ncbi:MAG: hypothetical protein JXR19_07765 [Bacteroidia bacterium]
MTSLKTLHIKFSGGWLLIITAILMLAFWTLFAILLPMQEPYIHWVQNKHWTWINSIGFSGSIFGLFSILVLFNYIGRKTVSSFIGLGLGLTGITFLTGLLFFEAFVIKGIALEQASLIRLGEGFYNHTPFKWATTLGGIFLSLGFILLGIDMLKCNSFKNWKIYILMLACPLFGLVIVPGNLRILGVLLYGIAFISIGLEILRKSSTTFDVRDSS